MNKMNYVSLALFIVLGLIPNSAWSTIRYVKPNDASVAWQTNSNVYSSLFEALSESVYGDEIWVAAGTYQPTSTNDVSLSFELKSNVKVYGGFIGTETNLEERDWVKNKTILSGTIDGKKSLHVVKAIGSEFQVIDRETLLDGFTISDGNAFYWSRELGSGGGLMCDNASPTISNVIFKNNYASNDGGGAFITNDANPQFNNCIFTQNSSYMGAGTYAMDSKAQFYNCLWYNNSSHFNSHNYTTSLEGKGIDFFNDDSDCLIANSIFVLGQYNTGITSPLYGSNIQESNLVSRNPGFINILEEDFRLHSLSEAVDAGNNSFQGSTLTDYYGNARVFNNIIDLGPTEGGVICPTLELPLHNSIVESSTQTTTIDFKGTWKETPSYTISKYILQFWNKSDDITTVDITNSLAHSITFNVGQKIYWRIGVETSEGIFNYSEVFNLSIPHINPIFVKEGAAGNGSSWSDALGSLNEALNIAVLGDEIWMAAGMYKPTHDTDVEASFDISIATKIYGGFAGSESSIEERDWRKNRTILSGNIGEFDKLNDNSYHIVSIHAENETLIDGLIIEDGYANNWTGLNGTGSGVLITNGEVKITNSIIKNNFSSSQGGAVSVYGGSLDCVNCIFKNNSTSNYGGAIYVNENICKITNSVFDNNTANYGGAVYQSGNNNDTSISNSIFTNNKSRYSYSQDANSNFTTYSKIGYYDYITSNIDEDPMFVNANADDYRLNILSPCINTGNNDSIVSWSNIDFSGKSRIQEETVDMGANEGGVICPSVISPEKDHLYKTDENTLTVTLKAGWGETEPTYNITKYFIEYWGRDGEVKTIDTDSELTVVIDLDVSDEYEWRAAVISEDGDINYSPIYNFTIGTQTPIYVKEGSTGDGSSWENAFGLLQDALEKAVNGDHIWIAKGTYYPVDGTARDVSFTINSDISLYGGFEGNETSLENRNWTTNKTILSGNIGDTDKTEDNSLSILLCNNSNTRDILIDGLVIQDGYSYNDGAGMLIKQGNIIVNNTKWHNNTGSSGSAVYLEEGNIKCYNNSFTYNTAKYGYIIYCYSAKNAEFINCTIVNNSCKNNVIIGNGKIVNSIIWNNYTTNSAVANFNIYNSCIQSGNSNNNNISKDPLMLDLDNGDYRLHYSSPCINTGANEHIPESITKDYALQDRIIDDVVDMGMFEGGVLTPDLVSPSINKSYLPSSDHIDINFSWEWNNDETKPAVQSYTLEYWMEDGNKTTIADITETTYKINLEAGTEYKWRIITHIEDEDATTSLIGSFSISHINPIYVKSDATGDGSSWNNAFGSLQDALSKAVSGDQIWVAKGTYTPHETDYSVSFNIKNGLKIYGGFEGSETELDQRNWNINETILSGEIADRENIDDNSRVILACNLSSIDSVWIDGITVEKVHTNYTQDQSPLFILNGNVYISNSTFRDNDVSKDGGAIFIRYGNLTLTNSILTNNTVKYGSGGAIYNNGGNANIINCVISNNNCSNNGGGIYSGTNDRVKVINSIVVNNSARSYPDMYSGESINSLIGDKFNGSETMSNPMFMDPENGDYRLNMNSPCIDRGSNEHLPVFLTSDIAKNQRILGDNVDLGCYEGGIVTPVNLLPAEQQIIKGEFLGTDVIFKWEWPEEFAQPEHDSFELQYWNNKGDTTTIGVLNTTSVSLKLNNGYEYHWRIRGKNMGAELDFSPSSAFSLTHDYAIKVKEGSSGYGSRWEQAFGDLQDAIDAAVKGDEIWIAKGTYYPSSDNDREESFNINKFVSIYGGFSGSEVYLKDRKYIPGNTVLSGAIGSTESNTDNSKRIINLSLNDKDTVYIDGITIEDVFNEQSTNDGGGAIRTEGGYLQLNKVIIKDNEIRGNGAGLFIKSNTDIVNSLIYKNTSHLNAGAIYAIDGTVRIINSTIANNTASSTGGVIISNYSNAFISNSILWDNISVSGGNTNNLSHTSIANSYISSDSQNSDDDPMFVDSDNDNYRLKSISQCINSGVNDSIPSYARKDIDGVDRVSFATVDMGAYEASYPQTIRPANESAETPGMGEVLGYTWTLGADIDGYEPNPNLMGATNYKLSLKVWDIEDPTNVYEELDLSSLGYISFNTDYSKGYQWKVGVKTEGYTYWSDTATFYVGSESPIYVKEGATGDGTSWESAFGSISDAVNNALTGDEIWVAKGTYKIDETLNIAAYTSLYGGFAGTESRKDSRYFSKEKSIISGDIGTVGDASDNITTLISIEGTTDKIAKGILIDGFTLTDANNNSNGGAIKASNASYKVDNCFISNNTANKGAAIYNEASTVTIYNTLINGNTSTVGVVYDNASSSSEIVNTTIAGNSTATFTNGLIANTIIYNNSTNTLNGNPSVFYSCIEGGFGQGEQIIAEDPDFMDAANGDYRLGEFSSCFDKGNDQYLPDNAYSDLYKNERRSFFTQVDIGAFEIGPFQLGRVEIESYSPANEETLDDYTASLKVVFNQAVKVIDNSAILVTPNNPISSVKYSDDKKTIWLDFNEDLLFGQTYTIEIPQEAYQHINNDKIPVATANVSFNVRACIPAVITLESANIDVCFNTDVELAATVDGDYLSVFTWKKKGEIYQENTELTKLSINNINHLTAGTYTLEVEDMCGNVTSENANFNIKETTPLVVKDKWNEIAFIDNASGQFSDFTWNLNNTQIETEQYVNLDFRVGDLFATALDKASGCIAYSDTMVISSDGVQALQLMPNPVQRSQNIVIKLPNQEGSVVVKMYDSAGALITSQQYNNSNLLNFQETNVKAGVYILEINAGGTIEKRKIIINN